MSATWKMNVVGLGVAAISGLAGCGSDGVVTADLEYVEASIATRQDLWLDTSLENRPMTLAQLGGERSTAIPVEVEIFGPVAAAWRRDLSGADLPRNADNLVSLWRVQDVVDGSSIHNAEAVDREVEGGIDYVPGNSSLPSVEGVDMERPGDRLIDQAEDEDLYVLVDWRDRLGVLLGETDLELARMLGERHPGCLE